MGRSCQCELVDGGAAKGPLRGPAVRPWSPPPRKPSNDRTIWDLPRMERHAVHRWRTPRYSPSNREISTLLRQYRRLDGKETSCRLIPTTGLVIDGDPLHLRFNSGKRILVMTCFGSGHHGKASLSKNWALARTTVLAGLSSEAATRFSFPSGS